MRAHCTSIGLGLIFRHFAMQAPVCSESSYVFIPTLPLTLLAHEHPAELPSGARVMASAPWI